MAGDRATRVSVRDPSLATEQRDEVVIKVRLADLPAAVGEEIPNDLARFGIHSERLLWSDSLPRLHCLAHDAVHGFGESSARLVDRNVQPADRRLREHLTGLNAFAILPPPDTTNQ